jgi:polyhydroxybutyrate depolymerase
MIRMLTFHLAAILLPALSVSTSAQAQLPSGPPRECDLVPVPGVSVQQTGPEAGGRPYRLFIPPDYPTPMALVLDLHGSGGSAEGQAATSGLESLAAREGFAVATLEADTGRRWNVPVTDDRADDVAYASDVITSIRSVVCIDAARVYATGFSGGGRMASSLGCGLNDRIAAIAPVAGLRWPGPCEGRPVPVLTFHGLADLQNPYDGNAEGRGPEWMESVPEALAGWAEHNGCDPDVVLEDPAGPLSTMRYEGCEDGAEVRLVRIDGLGHAWPRDEVDATAVMWEFFEPHRLPE